MVVLQTMQLSLIGIVYGKVDTNESDNKMVWRKDKITR